MWTREKLAPSTISTISIVVLSGVIALNFILQIHKKYDRSPPPARDPGILQHHLFRTLIWG